MVGVKSAHGFGIDVGVFFKGFLGKNTQITNILRALGSSCCEQRLLVDMLVLLERVIDLLDLVGNLMLRQQVMSRQIRG